MLALIILCVDYHIHMVQLEPHTSVEGDVASKQGLTLKMGGTKELIKLGSVGEITCTLPPRSAFWGLCAPDSGHWRHLPRGGVRGRGIAFVSQFYPLRKLKRPLETNFPAARFAHRGSHLYSLCIPKN